MTSPLGSAPRRVHHLLERPVSPAKRSEAGRADTTGPGDGASAAPVTPEDALIRMAAAEDTLRAVAAGEIDAFIVSDGENGQRVFSLSTADRPYRIFVENMREGAATLSPGGLVLYANRRLGELLSCSTETIVGSPLAAFVAGGFGDWWSRIRGPDGRGATTEIDLVNQEGVAFPVLVGSSPLEIDGEVLTCLTFTDLSMRNAQRREIASLEARADHDRIEVGVERERLEARLRQAERLESLGQLAGGVAHDFNNLLGAMLGFVGFAAEEVEAAAREGEQRWVAVAADLGQVERAISRAASLTHQLLAFARCEVVRPEVLNLNEVVVEVEQLLQRTLGEHIEFVSLLEDGLSPVHADRGQLEQVLVNLAVNARDAMPGGGILRVETAHVDLDEAIIGTGPDRNPGPYVRLRVSDTGTGMSEEAIRRAFEPFFTTKPIGQGTGLGLATVYGIITQAGGHVEIHSDPGAGTTITALLPCSTETAFPAPEPEPDKVPRRSGHETILVVEDGDALREVTRRTLARSGYQVLTAGTGAEALSVAADHPSDIALLVTDLVMPGLLGQEVAEKIRAVRPDTAVLFMSGYAPEILGPSQTLDPTITLIAKPFSTSALLTAVHQVLAQSAPAATKA